MTLKVKNCTRIDMKFRSGKVWDMKLIKSILTVVKKMKEFSDREITFSINVVFEKWKIVSFIKIEIQDVVDISSLITILNNNRLSRFLLLTRQEIDGYVTQKEGIEYWMDFHEYEEFELDYQRVSFKDMFNQKGTDMSVV